jgi:hypothetical protein
MIIYPTEELIKKLECAGNSYSYNGGVVVIVVVVVVRD